MPHDGRRVRCVRVGRLLCCPGIIPCRDKQFGVSTPLMAFVSPERMHRRVQYSTSTLEKLNNCRVQLG